MKGSSLVHIGVDVRVTSHMMTGRWLQHVIPMMACLFIIAVFR